MAPGVVIPVPGGGLPLSPAMLAYNAGKGYEALTAALMSLATVCVLLRLLARRVSKGDFWWDDYIIVLATLFGWTLAASLFWGVAVGLGKHQAALRPSSFKTLPKMAFMLQLAYACCIPLVKISVLCFYRRIFPNRGVLISGCVIGFLVVGWWIASVTLSIFGCTPVAKFWDYTITTGHCINRIKSGYGTAVINTATDFAIILLPLPIVWKLKMALRRKIYLSIVFSIGTFVGIASAVRIIYIIHIDATTDIWSAFALGALWCNIEAAVATICACLPTLMPLFRALKEKAGSQRSQIYYPTKESGSSKRSWPKGISRYEHSQDTVGPDTSAEGFMRLVDPEAATVRAAIQGLRPMGDKDIPMLALPPRSDIQVEHSLHQTYESRPSLQ